MPHTFRRLATAGCALTACAAATPAAAGAAAPNAAAARSGPLPYFDARDAGIDRAAASSGDPVRELPAADRAARRKLVSGLGRQAVIDADPITATPRTFGRLNGALSGPQPGDPVAVALRYVRTHAAAFGLAADDFATLRLSGRAAADSITHVRWRQEFRGIPAFDNELRVNVDGAGRVLNVLGSPRHALSVASITPRLSAADAIAALARNVGAARRPGVVSGPDGVRATTRFSSGDRARLTLFGDVRAVRLAWRLTLRAAPDAWYDAVVDATTGRILHRANLVKAINGQVFRNYPGAAAGGTQQTVSLDPYLTPGNTTTLAGPFAHAWSDLDDTSADPNVEAPAPSEEVVPGSYPFTDFTTLVGAAGACDPQHQCSWDHRRRASWDTNRQQNAVQVFWYVNHYRDHLAAGPIGFSPADGDFAGADAVDVETDDGAAIAQGLPDDNHIDNANMATPPDGQPPRMQMYLFLNRADSPFRDVNGGDDASVVYHEYTHGLSNRLVVDADGVEALDSPQAGAMGEAWSDWYAKDFLSNEGFQADTAADGEVDMGAYVDATPDQIRTQPLDCPVGSTSPRCPGTPGAGAGGYTYGDFAKIVDQPEVHADGEIWGETLWDLRTALGSHDAEAIITEGMRLSPPEPTYLDMRNAIILADQSLFGGAHVDAPNGIWATFAHRGMGFFAGATDGGDVQPVEDFSPPPAAGGPTGTITGRVIDAGTGAPLAGIVVGIGGLDTPPSSFTATSAADGTYTIGPVPVGTYPKLTFRPGAGYERFTAPVTITDGETVTANGPMQRDWVSTAAGGALAATNDNVFADFGCGTAGAFDLSQGLGWSAYNATTPGQTGLPPNPHQGSPPSATVRLPQAVDVTAFAVNPTNTCGDGTSAATKDFRVEVSTDGTTFRTVLEHTFARAELFRLTTLPIAVAGVRLVRITMLTNQSSAPGTSGEFFTDLTEFEVYGAPAPATGGGGAAPGGPAPAPAPQPQPGSGTAPAQALSRPTATIAASRTRGRATFTVGCALACRATATATLSRATVRRLRLSSTRLARVTRSLAAAGRRTFALNVSAATLRRIRARGVRTVTATVSVTIRDTRNQTRTLHRAVRIRVR